LGAAWLAAALTVFSIESGSSNPFDNAVLVDAPADGFELAGSTYPDAGAAPVPGFPGAG